MTATYRGASSVQYEDFLYDPERGLMDLRRMRGVPSVVYAEADSLKAAGWDVTTSRDGPYVNLSANRHRPDATFPVTERWSLETEILEKPIWALPKVEVDAIALDGVFCDYKDNILEALRLGLPNTGYPAGSGADDVLRELYRGIRSYEHEYLKLTRRYTFNFQNGPPENLSLETDRKLVYTKAQLEALLNIPAGVMFSLPTDTQDAHADAAGPYYRAADNPEGYTAFWGWRLREQNAEITSGTTGTHEISFIHAQWSMFSYRRAT